MAETPRTPGVRQYKDLTRIMLRPIASGIPLGFFSFAIGMFMLGCLALGVIPLSEVSQVGMVLVLFVFPLELLATIFAFLARDSMSAATLGLFTTSWLTLGVSEIVGGAKTSIALGVYQLAFTTVVLLLAIMAIQVKPFFTLLLLTAGSRMLFSGVYQVGGSHAFYTTSAYIAFVTTALALYGGVAFSLEDGKQRPVLPLFRRGAANEAFDGYDKQLERLEAEPGVRQQL